MHKCQEAVQISIISLWHSLVVAYSTIHHQQFLQHPEDAEAEGKGEGQFI